MTVLAHHVHAPAAAPIVDTLGFEAPAVVKRRDQRRVTLAAVAAAEQQVTNALNGSPRLPNPVERRRIHLAQKALHKAQKRDHAARVRLVNVIRAANPAASEGEVLDAERAVTRGLR